MNASLRLYSLTILIVLGSVLMVSAQPERNIVPRHPYAVQLPEMGRMLALPEDCAFGLSIHPIGDVNQDSIDDWIVSRDRCDTMIDGKRPVELLLFKGVRGGLPDIADRLRIGPTEIGVNVVYIASGDWDGDGHPDICASISHYGDTTRIGSTGIQLTDVVVWWGNAEGIYSLSDTSRLEIGALDGWLLPDGGYSVDLDHNGISDLLISDVKGYSQGVRANAAPVQVWLGERGRRWGQSESSLSTWQWWNPPRESLYSVFPRVQWVDQDKDDYIDLVLYNEGGGGGRHGLIRMIYGKPGVVLDTANIIEQRLDSAWGKYALFADVTGDKVPELLVNTGGQEALKAYVGFKGQRLHEQYGIGNEPPHPGQPIWWGKPWATIPLPGQLHSAWAAAGWSDIDDFGDGGLDGVGDVWVVTVPDLVCYQGGRTFDSLYDGWITPPCGGFHARQIGDIDGSGKWTLAWAYRCDGVNGIAFIQPTDSMPWTGKVRALPPGSDRPTSGIVEPDASTTSLNVRIEPNPSPGVVSIRWRPFSSTRATVTITDVRGQRVMTRMALAGESHFIWDASETFGGTYFITVTLEDISETLPISITK